MSNKFIFALREDIKDEKQFLPSKAHETDTGYDVRFAPVDRKSITIKPFQHVRLDLGFRTLIPEGYWMELRPRSSSFAKKHLHFLYGVLDESWEGYSLAAVQYIPEVSFTTDIVGHMSGYKGDTKINAPDLTINFGDPIAQLIPVKRQEMNIVQASNSELDNLYKWRGDKRGTGGFGSTG